MSEKLKTLPRWLIFLLDLTGVGIAIVVSQILRFNFDLTLALAHLPVIVGTVLAINAILFYVFKSFAGIIRYTTAMDTFRLLAINVIASIAYLIIGVVFFQNSLEFIPKSTVLINFFIVSFGLIGYRIGVRHLYKTFFSDQAVKLRIKVAVYDTSEQGLLTKRVINDYPQSRMQVVGFIDDRSNKQGKKIEGIPIFDLREESFKKLKEEEVRLIIIANKVLGTKLTEIVDRALQYGIRVQQVPPIRQWLNGKLATEQLKDVNIEDLLERDTIKINNENIFYAIKGKKILVTGAAGSIGSEMVRQLLQFKPALVILCDTAESPLHELVLELHEKFPNGPVRSYIGDICDKVRMEHLFEVFNPEIVFHAAAYKHVPLMEENPSVAVVNNVMGTKLIAELSVTHGVEKFVMVSTDKAVNPTNIMGASKRIAEIFIQSTFRHLQQTAGVMGSADNTAAPTMFITTRFGNVLGSNGSVIPRFKQQIEKGGPVTVTHPDITRYFMTIPEACQLVIEAGVMGQGGEIFVFDMGSPVKVTDLANKMIRLSGKTPGVDVEIVYTGLRPGEKLYEELLNDSENTLATYHEKIMIAKVREYDFATVSDKINQLITSARKHYTYETVAIMKDLVPEFISKNSVFESLDAKVK